MAAAKSDALLIIGLVALSYYVALSIYQQLVYIQEVSKIKLDGNDGDGVNERPEDVLKLETLGQLTRHTNLKIKESAVQILAERALRDDVTRRKILEDITGLNFERRDKALACLRLIIPYCFNGLDMRTKVCSNSTFSAVVKSLCHMLPEARVAEASSPSESACHTQAERDALHLLGYAFPYSHDETWSIEIVSDWLVFYPFGGRNASMERKMEVITGIIKGTETYEKDVEYSQHMRNLLHHIFYGQGFQDALADYHFIEYPLSDSDSYDTLADDNTIRTGNRPREESFEEVALRRRRREAMVLGVNGRPLQPDDIIQRDPVAIDEQTEEAWARIAKGTEKTQRMDAEGWWGWLCRLRPNGLATTLSE